MNEDISTSENSLARKHCVACEGGIPPLSLEEARGLLPQVEGWQISDDGLRIHREWIVKNFVAGIEFFDEVAKLSEAEGHHPDLHIEGYRNVRVEIWTHAVNGLTENDFILAAKINQVPIKLKAKVSAG